jgi:peptide chain release factor subunit 1
MTLNKETGPVSDVLDRLAAFEATGTPVLSVYVDARADEHGKDRFGALLRKDLPDRARTYRAHTPERESFEASAAQIAEYLASEVVPRANGIALFACAPAGLFEAVQIEAPFEATRLYVGPQPHLYPLARILDQYRRYAAVVADTHRAHIYVFGLRRPVSGRNVTSPKTRRVDAGGWSQMRYQRHVDEWRRHHAREVADALARVMAQDQVEDVVLAGDEVIVPLVQEQLPAHLAARVVDVVRLDIRTPEHEVLAATLESFRRHDARTDAQKVQRVLDEARGGGLGVAGARDTLAALAGGQVDELVISAVPGALEADEGVDLEGERLGAELVARARKTGARVTFVEDPRLVEPMRGVGALLRYRIAPDMAVPPLAAEEGVQA